MTPAPPAHADAGAGAPPVAPPPVVSDALTERLGGLVAAVEAGRDRIDDKVLLPAAEIAVRAGERLKLSGEHTIVALAGATGSGKSSLFNALTDLELAGVGVRRPTTSWALACAWGPDGAGELLEWMGIPPRHQVSRHGMLEGSGDGPSLQGLVLLDLPDHDSTEVSHHVEMDRLVKHSDTLIWVLDPQKYADAAIHERYIKPMAGFAAVTLVVLNQIDRIPAEQRQAALDDVRRLLRDDGLPDVKVLGVSATRGDGLADLRGEIAARIQARVQAKERLLADIGDRATDLAGAGGTVAVPEISDDVRARFDDELAECAGVSQVVDAIRTSTRRRALQRAGWPVARWIRGGRKRKDALDLGDEFSSAALAKVAAPEVGQVQQANADLAIRDTVDRIAGDLKLPWRNSVRHSAVSAGRTIAPALNQALRNTDLRLDRTPIWWRIVQALQWLLLLVVVVAVLWSAQVGLQQWFDVDTGLPDLGHLAGVPVSVWAAGGGVLAGIVLEVLSRIAARSGGNRRAARADEELRASIASVGHATVLEPVKAELARYGQFREGVSAALRSSARR